MTHSRDTNLDFTDAAMESMYDVVDDAYFRDRDAELIYKALESSLKPVPFCSYLKKYIHAKAELDGDFEEIPIRDYQAIIRESFSDNCTPASFTPVSSKLSALSKNWLTQQSVGRSVVFLLGFGLNMSADDVNDFLIRALREPGINFKDPFEVICHYCLSNGYSYIKYEQLWQAYLELPPNTRDADMVFCEATIGYRHTALAITDDASLLSHLAKLKVDSARSRLSVTARRKFDLLYDAARDIIAAIYNELEDEKNALLVEQYRDKLATNDKLFDCDKRERIEKKRTERQIFTREDITPRTVESVLCSAIPLDRHRNLIPLKYSRLNGLFYGKRFSRQHLNDILQAEIEIERFDLITLNFFIWSQKTDEYPNNKARYLRFVDSTNEILEECGMGELYVANPYECFVLMCMLADDPLGTYADVWEMAYDTSE